MPSTAEPLADAKPPADRLYGRLRGHALRPRQQVLLDVTLPRLRFPLGGAATPHAAFTPVPEHLALEIGFGGGEHALAEAAAHPGTGLIACEVFENGLCSLLSRLAPDGTDAAAQPLPGNLRLWDDDARILLRALPDACLDRAYLMFPDPWPKARHAKRRFVHPAQVALMARVMKPGAEWRIASDDPTYQEWVETVMGGQSLFRLDARFHNHPIHWPTTRYELKAIRAGRTPIWWCFIRTAQGIENSPRQVQQEG